MTLLSPSDQKELLQIARKAIADKLRHNRGEEIHTENAQLRLPRGVFVTLHLKGQLRGCIGTFQSSGELYKSVVSMARAAAFEDRRFPALREDELDEIDIEISVLSQLEEITDTEVIEIGKHGLYISRGFQRGVLLPQVASEHNWDRKTFLEHTCMKAGLPVNAWKEGAKIEIFSAQIFGEKE